MLETQCQYRSLNLANLVLWVAGNKIYFLSFWIETFFQQLFTVHRPFSTSSTKCKTCRKDQKLQKCYDTKREQKKIQDIVNVQSYCNSYKSVKYNSLMALRNIAYCTFLEKINKPPNLLVFTKVLVYLQSNLLILPFTKAISKATYFRKPRFQEIVMWQNLGSLEINLSFFLSIDILVFLFTLILNALVSFNSEST